MPSAARSHSLSALVLGVAFLLGALMAAPTTVQAQDSTSPTRNQKATHYSLYYENFENDNFKDARSDLMWIIENAPGFPGGDDRNYDRIFEMYEELAKQASGETRVAYLDTAATYLMSATEEMDKRDITYSQYEWEIKKGRFLQMYRNDIPDLKETGLTKARVHYRKAFELAPQEIDAYYIRQVLQGFVENNELDKALAFVDQVSAKRGSDEKVSKILSTYRDNIFSKNPQARISYLEGQLKQTQDSLAVMQKLFGAYNEQGNIQQASNLAPELMELQPPAETVRQIAQMRLDDGRPEAALKAYNKARDQGASLKAEDHFNIGTAHQQIGNLQQARAQYRKALEKQSDFGRALVAIGDLYARAVSQCGGSSMGRSDKAVYWAAVDKYQEAKELDSSVSSTANSKIQTYRKYFPTQEDVFYRNDWSEGESFTIDYGCYAWISETTTVRAAP